MKIILGTGSPRRREIFNFFSLPFEQVSPDFDESQVLFHGDPKAFAKEVAKRKAQYLTDRYPNDIILTADTVVFLGGRLFMKPETMEEAAGMLSELAGKEHQVFTGVCVAQGEKFFLEAEETRVFLNELTEDQIRSYHQRFLPLDKAGGYAIQKGGSLIVKRIEGCYYNSMGLPIQTVGQLLRRVGIELWDYLKAL